MGSRTNLPDSQRPLAFNRLLAKAAYLREFRRRIQLRSDPRIYFLAAPAYGASANFVSFREGSPLHQLINPSPAETGSIQNLPQSIDSTRNAGMVNGGGSTCARHSQTSFALSGVLWTGYGLNTSLHGQTMPRFVLGVFPEELRLGVFPCQLQ